MAIADLVVRVTWMAPPESMTARLPLRRSRYVPAVIPVVTVASSVLEPPLIATKPLSPRENAIALAPLSHQWLMSVPATTWRKLTMLRIERSRCSQTHCPIVAVSRLDAHVTFTVHPFASDGGPIEFPAGQSNA